LIAHLRKSPIQSHADSLNDFKEMNTMMKRVLLWLVFVCAGAGVAVPLSAQAQGGGDLVVSPTRVVFEARTRSAKVTLANRGSATATFRISLIDMAMDDFGQMGQAAPEDTSLPSAKNLIRYAPRQIDIAPGEIGRAHV